MIRNKKIKLEIKVTLIEKLPNRLIFENRNGV